MHESRARRELLSRLLSRQRVPQPTLTCRSSSSVARAAAGSSSGGLRVLQAPSNACVATKYCVFDLLGISSSCEARLVSVVTDEQVCSVVHTFLQCCNGSLPRKLCLQGCLSFAQSQTHERSLL